MENKLNRIKTVSITKDISLSEALKIMDMANSKLLIILEENSFISLLSIGDIQRAILKGKPLSDGILYNIRSQVVIAHDAEDIETIKARMLEGRDEFMPIVDSNNQLVNIIFWDELFENDITINIVDIPVVIMAGGFGTRLKPLTNVIPKPLIPYKESTLLDNIISNFKNAGCTQFLISLNYRAELIQFYIDHYFSKQDISISCFIEDKPLGTAGSLTLIRNDVKTTFFLTNCDIVINHNYADIYEFHKAKGNALTMVTSLKSMNIPYGTVTINEQGLIHEMIEKPEYQHWINTGFYVLEPEVFNFIDEDTYFGMNNLIERLIQNGYKVGMFPLNEKSWEDMGEWKDYRKHLLL